MHKRQNYILCKTLILKTNWNPITNSDGIKSEWNPPLQEG
jgi:hypothetical protein